MTIHSIQISNFKSLYGTHTFDFDKMKGLIKLSGPIGSGKTSIGEAILWGLYGNVKSQNGPQLISWNEKTCKVELNLTCKNKNIHIIRDLRAPLIVEVDGKTISSSNKRDMQNILEEEILDVPKFAITKMCIISFNAFNSLASMTPFETKMFLDEIFGFKLFTKYNNEVVIEKKNQQNELIKLDSIYRDTLEQIENIKQKQIDQTSELKSSIDVNILEEKRKELVKEGVLLKEKKEKNNREKDEKVKEIEHSIKEHSSKMTEAKTLGKQAKEHYMTFKSGICPTCGQKVDINNVMEYKDKYEAYIRQYKEHESYKQSEEIKKKELIENYDNISSGYDDEMDILRKKISKIDGDIRSYNYSVQLLNDNYDDLIKEYEEKAKNIKEKMDSYEKEVSEWGEMNDLFSKTLRYNLLETLIPHINKSIQFFINKLDQSYRIEYDQEFKAHVFVDSFDKEISYNNLSTGQRKSLDLAIVFGILQNIIANVECNILFLDELFSNMDSDARNIMLTLLNEQISTNKTVFVINHAEMPDDMFQHKIRVRLENRKIMSTEKGIGDVIVKCSKYEQVF